MIKARVGKTNHNPVKVFLGPGRRRSDQPLIVITIVLCLGISMIASILQVTATLWAGSQVNNWFKRQAVTARETTEVRQQLVKQAEVSAMVLRRVCLNVAKTDADKQECLIIAPPPPPGSVPPR